MKLYRKFVIGEVGGRVYLGFPAYIIYGKAEVAVGSYVVRNEAFVAGQVEIVAVARRGVLFCKSLVNQILVAEVADLAFRIAYALGVGSCHYEVVRLSVAPFHRIAELFGNVPFKENFIRGIARRGAVLHGQVYLYEALRREIGIA